MPISARVSATAGVLLGLTACEGQEPTFTATIDVTSSARVEDDRGPAMAGTARLEIVSDIDQEIALEELAVWARGGPIGDVDAIPWADVSTSRSWPLAVESDRTAVVEVEWRTSLPSACPDARYLLAAFATLIGTSGPPVEARDVSGDVTTPMSPEDLPWSWLVTTEGEVGGWGGGDGLAVGAEDVAWSIAGGQLVRIDPSGITRVGATVGAGRMVASEDGVYSFRADLDGGPLRLTAHDLAGQERWEAELTGVELPWLVVATPDTVMASGVARSDVALGDVVVPAGASFVAAFGADDGEGIQVRWDVPRPRSAVPLSGGGFAATAMDLQDGLLAFDASLSPREGLAIPATHVARHASGPVLVASEQGVMALSPELAVLWEAPAPCGSVEDMVALGDGGALLATGSALIRLDAEGRTRGVREIGGVLSLAQRDDTVVVLWRDDDGASHAGRLDLGRLAEVGL